MDIFFLVFCFFFLLPSKVGLYRQYPLAGDQAAIPAARKTVLKRKGGIKKRKRDEEKKKSVASAWAAVLSNQRVLLGKNRRGEE